jgi:tripartite-type tricarboxylate transporter receptor subunit TctC
MIARRALLVAIAALASAGPATAQSYPARVIKLVVPYTPGSPNDVMARLLTQNLQTRLGQAIVVDNKPGAAGRTRAVNRVPACGM